MTRINKNVKIGNTNTKLADLIDSPKCVYNSSSNSKLSYTFTATGLFVIFVARINGPTNAGLYIVNHANEGTTLLTTVTNVGHGTFSLNGTTIDYTISGWSRMIIFQIG